MGNHLLESGAENAASVQIQNLTIDLDGSVLHDPDHSNLTLLFNLHRASPLQLSPDASEIAAPLKATIPMMVYALLIAIAPFFPLCFRIARESARHKFSTHATRNTAFQSKTTHYIARRSVRQEGYFCSDAEPYFCTAITTR